MKKLYFLSLLVSGLAFAQTSDFFTGTGTLFTNGWVKHSGTEGQLSILATTSDSGNSLSFAGLAASTGNRTSVVAGNTEDVNKALTASMTGSIYYSVLLKPINTTGLHPNTAAGDYFIALGGTAGASVTALPSRIYIRTGSVTDTVNFGVLNNSGGTATPSFIATDFPINQTIFFVVKYDLATNTASLWANPTPGSAEPAAGATNATGTTAAPTQIASIAIRQGGTVTTGTGNVEIDEIRVAATWAEVTPAGTAGLDKNNINGLSIYPNPSNGLVNITTSLNGELQVNIFDMLGKEVANTKVTNNTLNVSNLTSGVYVIKITEEGKTATRKLVIE